MKVSYFIAVLIVALLSPVLSVAQPLKDPRTRDEDLSGAIVTVTTTLLPGGIYEYIYDLESPVTNKGRILSFDIDISCVLDFGVFAYPEPSDQYFNGDYSADGQHVPMQVYGVYGFTGSMSVTHDNQVGWLVAMNPGDIAKGFRILSPAPPGPRQYRLYPSMDTDGWDYATYGEGYPGLPWIPDFTVTGMTTGPACALAPPPVTEPMRYPGTNKENKESEAVNNLLTYSAPLQNHLHVPAGSTEYALTIHYGQDIDADSFKIKPKKLRTLFNPEAGTSETVQVPLDKEKNKLKFEVRSRVDSKHGDDEEEEQHGESEKDHDSHDDKSKEDKKDKDDDEKKHGAKDKDIFEIRVDES